MMDDDGDCWWVEKESPSERRTRKGRNAGASRDMQNAKTCGQATFFFSLSFPLRPPVEIYMCAPLPLCNVEPAGLALTAPIEKALCMYSCIVEARLCVRATYVSALPTCCGSGHNSRVTGNNSAGKK